MKERNLVLIAGKNDESARMLQRILRTSGLTGEVAEAAEGFASKAHVNGYDLILLDAEAFGTRIFDTVKELKGLKLGIPLVILCDRMEDFDMIYGYDIGADDFILKPFSPVLLGAKLKAMIRLSRCCEKQLSHTIEAGPFSYNCSTLQMYKNGRELLLTAKENAIMKLFLDNEDRFFTKKMIYQMIWGSEISNDNAVMVYINRIRAKIENDPANPQYLQTVRGCGYRFSVPEGKCEESAT